MPPEMIGRGWLRSCSTSATLMLYLADLDRRVGDGVGADRTMMRSLNRRVAVEGMLPVSSRKGYKPDPRHLRSRLLLKLWNHGVGDGIALHG